MANSQYRNSNLLYRPSVSVWTARKMDKAESAKVNADNGARGDVARVYKDLLPDAASLDKVQKYGGYFREWVKSRTLPWDTGTFIGQVSKHMDLMSEAGDKFREFWALYDTFEGEYAQAYENARFTMGALFNPADYPGIAEVKSKFHISLDVLPLPATEDFRIVDGMPQEEVDRLCSISEQAMIDKTKAAMDTAYERIFSVVSKMGVTLSQFGDKEIKKFNDSLLGNIEDLIAVMPALNITGDPKLAALTDECKILLDYDLKDLRKDEGTRKAAIKDAQALAGKFAKIMGRGVVSVTPTAQGAMTPTTTTAGLFADMLTGDD